MFFFFNVTATTEVYTLSLPAALPISRHAGEQPPGDHAGDPHAQLAPLPALGDQHRLAGQLGLPQDALGVLEEHRTDRKSTRLNSSHANISYAVFCLKKKNRPLQL